MGPLSASEPLNEIAEWIERRALRGVSGSRLLYTLA